MKKEKDDTVSTFLGQDAAFEGTLEFKGAIRLDGKLKGKVLSAGGTVIIGDNAVVEAEINVDTVIVKGGFSGTIDARKRIEAFPPARITGEIKSPVIIIDSGVVFNGSCAMEIPTGKKTKTG